MSLSDLIRVAKTYVAPLFDPAQSSCAICCHPSKVDEIKEEFSRCVETLVEITKQRQGQQYARKILNFTYNGVLNVGGASLVVSQLSVASYTPVISGNYYHEDQRRKVHPAGNLSPYFGLRCYMGVLKDRLRTVCSSLKDLNF